MYQSIGKLADYPDGRAVEVRLGARRIAVYRRGDRLHAIKNICPHEGGLLHRLPPRDGVAVCATHGWRFDLESGQCVRGNPGARVAVYPIKVEGDGVWIDVG